MARLNHGRKLRNVATYLSGLTGKEEISSIPGTIYPMITRINYELTTNASKLTSTPRQILSSPDSNSTAVFKEKFITGLRILAQNCDFKDPDEMIRDRIMFGTSSTKVREKLMAKSSTLTPDKAVEIARSCETSQEQLSAMATTQMPLTPRAPCTQFNNKMQGKGHKELNKIQRKGYRKPNIRTANHPNLNPQE